jgi:outer membrane lipoprotein SlyB
MRSSTRLLSVASAVTLSAVLAACAGPDPYGPNNYPVSQQAPGATYYPYGTYRGSAYPAQQAYVEYGRVTNVSMISAGTGPALNRSAAGGVIGAIIGGVLGNQIGSGTGRAAATVLGAGAGAVVGSNAGRTTYNASYPVYRVTVQTDQGQWRTYDVNATGDLRPGDRVRIENGVIYLG